MTMNTLHKEDKREVYRLTDMVVREVSIVDRPANLRPFLLMKAEGNPGPELEPDGKGGFRVKAAPPVEKAEPESTPAPAEETSTQEAAKSIEVDDELVAASLAVGLSEVEKVGRKLAAKREQAIRQAIELLVGVLDDTTKAIDRLTTANKSLAAELDAERANMRALRAEHETLKSQHVALVRSVNKARGTVQKSNILPSEERHVDTGRVVWPRDMNG